MGIGIGIGIGIGLRWKGSYEDICQRKMLVRYLNRF